MAIVKIQILKAIRDRNMKNFMNMIAARKMSLPSFLPILCLMSCALSATLVTRQDEATLDHCLR